MGSFGTMEPAPVLLMIRALGLGGTERQLTETARFLDRRRFEPHVACLIPEGIRRSELDAIGIPLVTFRVPSFGSPAVLRGAWELAAYIRKHRIQIVHTFDVPMNMFGVLPARLAGTPVVLSSQRGHRDLSKRSFRPVLRAMDRVVDGIVVNCEAMRRHLVTDEGTRADKIHVCYNGIDTEEFYPGPADRPDSLKPGVVIGVVCALRPEKGLDTLIEAFAAIRPEFPEARLAIVGSGSEEQLLKDLVVSRGLADYCHFEPGTREVAYWLRCIDIFVLPSLSEALSNSLMEAMACGCCPVASNVGGNSELVVPDRTGLLFEPGDAEGLSAQLRILLRNEYRRKEMGQASASRIRDSFSHFHASEQMGGIYEAMLARSR